MKSCTIILIIALSLSTFSGYSQSDKVTLKFKNAGIKDLIKEVEKQTPYKFLYRDDVVENILVNIDEKELSLDNILELVLAGSGLDFKLLENDVIVIATHELLNQTRIFVTVVDGQSEEALSGVNVTVFGTSAGEVTGLDGTCSIKVKDLNSTLVFSYVGYITDTIEVNGKTDINIKLNIDYRSLQEVVVVGYGISRKSDLTGSIVSIKSEDINNLPVITFTEALQGLVAGVQINKSSGRPGASSDIIIRGVGSINGLSPLFVIDGIPSSNNTYFNPQDVASIDIIKDASAAAIYGSQAAGGVILVTTKSGKYNSKTNIDFSSMTGIRSITKTYDLLRTDDFIRGQKGIGQYISSWDNPDLPDVDWVAELYHPAIEQSNLLSISGGTAKAKYYLSAGYDRENGIQILNYWQRFSLRLNSDYKLGNKVTLGHQIFLARVDQNPQTVDYPWNTLPYMPVYNPDGSYASVPVESGGFNNVAVLHQRHEIRKNLVINSNIYADWKIYKDLTLKLTGSGNFGAGIIDNFTEADNLRPRVPTQSSYTKSSSFSESYILNSVLSYSKSFSEVHDFTFMAGYEIKASNSSSLSATANTFPVDVSQSFSLSSNPNKIASGSLGFGRGLSQFARSTYSLDNRFFITANIRRDGSPKFGPEKSWGVFPSVSVGWKLNEEEFFKKLNLDFISMLKPRLSWGKLGSDAAIGGFAYDPSYRIVDMHSFDETTQSSGFNTIKVVNRDIRWEEISTTDFGLDINLFRNKFSLVIDLYSRQTNDMLYNLQIPLSSGISMLNQASSTMPVNLGTISNKGYEISIWYTSITGDFRYSISGNMSHNSNEVINLGIPNSYIYSGGLDGFTSSSPFKTVNGKPVGQIYGFIADGLIQNQQEIDALNENATKVGLERGTLQPGQSQYYNKPLTGIGDLKFRDLNGDGVITDGDRTFIGNPWPKLQFGLGLQLGFKNFDLSSNLYALHSMNIFNGAIVYSENFLNDNNTTAKVFNASLFMGNGLTDQPRLGQWDPQNPGLWIRDPNQNYSQYSTYYVQDGSYLKIKNISFGYTFSKNHFKYSNMERLRIFFAGQNLFTFTKFTGLDPEFTNDVKNYSLYGIKTFPQTKLYSFGAEVSF